VSLQAHPVYSRPGPVRQTSLRYLKRSLRPLASTTITHGWPAAGSAPSVASQPGTVEYGRNEYGGLPVGVKYPKLLRITAQDNADLHRVVTYGAVVGVAFLGEFRTFTRRPRTRVRLLRVSRVLLQSHNRFPRISSCPYGSDD
jgi:hypothetical protein